ncbi:ARM repeat superfamily protein [Artemisia annua]|uniref:ARM repeat superfamily protein n=2 Tax=Anthemideae TaxID=102810 RepID=A0A2U1QP60_ARTAN|nr:ARM repeat superfamily protein [Artemisia annua]
MICVKLKSYTLFPLLLLLEAAVECRNNPPPPLKISDAVAEGVLRCLEHLLIKCHVPSLDQMVVLLKKLTNAALLSPSQASEEFREGVIRCFKALLNALCFCSNPSCECKHLKSLPRLIDNRYPQSSFPSAAVTVGHWLSLLLKAADVEAARGHIGSSKIRVEAFMTLRVLVAKVGTAYQLAFFLPGVVSQIGKVLLVSKTMISGAAGSMEAMDQALRALIEFLMIVLQDEANISSLDDSDIVLNTDKSPLSFLEELRHLKKQDRGQVVEKKSIQESSQSDVKKSLHVERTKDWVATASSHVNKLLSAIFPHLCVHPAKRVRQGTMAAIQGLLTTCSRTLKESRLMLLVGTADQLAFFLPGVVSQIGKVLHVSKTMISGAAGSTEAMDQALRALIEFLMIVLQDEANISSLDDSDIDLNMDKSPLSFLEELRHLKKQGHGQLVEKKSIQESSQSDAKKSLHVERTKDWVATASSHVNKLLSAIFPHECLCALVCDDDEEVSEAAQMFLESLFSSSGRHHLQCDFADIFNRLFEKLPEVVVGGEQSLAHSQKLLVLIYYSGPQLVKDRLLHSPVTAARFFDTLTICLSQNSVFSGSLDKLLLERPSSVGYLRSITEMKATTIFENGKTASVESNAYEDPNSYKIQNEYDLPRMPPWFSSSGNQKLYQSLAGILRLVSLSLVAGSRSEGNLSIIKDIPLSYLRKLIGDVRNKEYMNESWQSWYKRTNSGKLVRQASTAACILNEMVFGLSDQAVDNMKRMFRNNISGWDVSSKRDLRSQLIDSIGSILHEYLSPEIWNLPLEQSNVVAGDINVHFFHDNAMLHQVLIDGIGIFNLSLKSDFVSSGFLHSSLYVLLENLICSNFQIKRASDAVLHVIAATSNYPTVGHLVLANSDYVIDSICRQLRHLDLNPHVPSVLAAILSYIGVAHKILPLMEEPMRSISQELEILGRHQHPELTISFLKAVAEIAKASKLEACSLPSQAEAYHTHVKSELSNLERKTMNRVDDGDHSSLEEDADKYKEQLEAVFFKLKESKSYRRTVGSISISCITAATPLLSSLKQTACLVALDIVEDGIVALAEVEESYKQETRTREVLIEALQSYSLHDLADTLDAENDGTDENRLLPAMNKIWPFLITCIRNGKPLTTRRCAAVISRSRFNAFRR